MSKYFSMDKHVDVANYSNYYIIYMILKEIIEVFG
jgi:hypothetical protein